MSGLPKQPFDPNLIVGFDTADDAGVYRLRDDLALVQTLDFFTPIVDDPHDYGRIAATNALSDIYAMGGQPLNALSFVAWPVDTLGTAPLRQVLDGAAAICAEAGITISGGHSIVDEEPKFGLFVTGTIDPRKVVANDGARPGDALVLTKPIGTGILTTAVKRNAAPVRVLETAVRSMTSLPSSTESLAPALNMPEKTIFLARAVMSTKPPAPAVTCGRKESFETFTEPSRPISRKESSEASKPAPWK